MCVLLSSRPDAGKWEGGWRTEGLGARKGCKKGTTLTRIHTISTALTALVQGWKSVGGKGKGVMVVADKDKAAAGPLAGQLRYGRSMCVCELLINLGIFSFGQ